MRKLLQPYLDALPQSEKQAINQKTVVSHIREKADKFTEELKKKFAKRLIPLKIDCACRKGRSFLGVTTQLMSMETINGMNYKAIEEI